MLLVIKINLHLNPLKYPMEDGGVDTTVIDSRQHKMGRMADFPPPIIFDLKNHNVPQIKSQTQRQALMNLVSTTLF